MDVLQLVKIYALFLYFNWFFRKDDLYVCRELVFIRTFVILVVHLSEFIRTGNHHVKNNTWNDNWRANMFRGIHKQVFMKVETLNCAKFSRKFKRIVYKQMKPMDHRIVFEIQLCFQFVFYVCFLSFYDLYVFVFKVLFSCKRVGTSFVLRF